MKPSKRTTDLREIQKHTREAHIVETHLLSAIMNAVEAETQDELLNRLVGFSEDMDRLMAMSHHLDEIRVHTHQLAGLIPEECR